MSRKNIQKQSNINPHFLIHFHGFHYCERFSLYWTHKLTQALNFTVPSLHDQKFHLPTYRSSFFDLNCRIAFAHPRSSRACSGYGAAQVRHRRIPLKFRLGQFSLSNWVGLRWHQIRRNHTRLRARFKWKRCCNWFWVRAICSAWGFPTE